jgi:hypothetical protein
MIPDGDRRHAAQSGRVVNEEHAVPIRKDDVVGALVLNHDALDEARRLMGEPPTDDIFERLLP